MALQRSFRSHNTTIILDIPKDNDDDDDDDNEKRIIFPSWCFAHHVTLPLAEKYTKLSRSISNKCEVFTRLRKYYGCIKKKI